MNLLTDVFFFDNLKVIEESNANGTMTLEGTFQRADKPNQNKRIYPRSVLNTQVNRLQDIIEARRLCGELDHPKNETVKLANASHLVTKLWMEGDEVYGRAELLNTPAGKVAQTLVNDGVSVGISSRGLGTLSEAISSDGYKTVNDDYKLVTFDLVADPSTKGAYPTLSESVEHFNDTSRGELKDRTYITLLKQEINSRFGDNEMNENMYKGYSKKKKKGGLPESPCLPSAKMSKRARPANEDVFDALEQNIRLFITENEDPELAAQFVLEHKDAIIQSLLTSLEAISEVSIKWASEKTAAGYKARGDTPPLSPQARALASVVLGQRPKKAKLVNVPPGEVAARKAIRFGGHTVTSGGKIVPQEEYGATSRDAAMRRIRGHFNDPEGLGRHTGLARTFQQGIQARQLGHSEDDVDYDDMRRSPAQGDPKASKQRPQTPELARSRRSRKPKP